MRLLSGLLTAAALLCGCATPRPPTPEPPAPPTPTTFAGFDTWRYPGDDALRAWREASPYRWVGYYLPAPCRRDSSWVGRRASLERMGWGVAVLYVGQQVFEGQPPPPPDSPAPIRCSRTLLSEAQGGREAADAVAQAAAEGFPPGTTVFLNVERSETLPAAFTAYYRAWMDGVLRDGRYRPGTYAHRRNADDLFALARDAYRAAGRTEAPPFWVAGGAGFALDQPPEAVGVPYAAAWQGALDVPRTWGGVTITVDENVARRPSPSAPGSE
ncbi:MAG: DUF1906 domain-containing protein [Rubricoccaceae bacterium]|nr:DUF1906 domain-containing protein [Rubricoccaceae bacterium]